MINVLLCGKGSYIGRALINGMKDRFNLDELDMQTSDWREFDFSKFDVVIHLAAIVHKPEIEDEELYFRVNTLLPAEVAEKSISQGVKHFVFFSTMGVYGVEPSLKGKGQISIDTPCTPVNLYAESKFKAEKALLKLHSEKHFILSIIRPPNVYGESCPGNYYRFMKLCARYIPVFPLVRHNRFSMISTENLSAVIEKAIIEKTDGVICPQDPGEQSNSKRIAELARQYKRFHYQSTILGRILYVFYLIIPLKQIRNLFGDSFYDETLTNPIPFTKLPANS